MGLFKKIKRKVKSIAKVKNIKRAAAGFATGGLSEVARKTVGTNLVRNVENVFLPSSLKQVVRSAAVVASPFTGGASLQFANLGTPQPTGGSDMGLGNVLGGLQGVLGTVGTFGGSAGAVAQIGSGFLSGFLPAQGPVRSAFPQSQFPVVQTMAAAPIIRGAAQAVAGFAAPILARMSQALGRNVSLRAAMIIIRRLGKTLSSPTAIAAAVGLSVSELSQLLTASALSGSSGRRMNVGNVKALRRAHRRIKGFHKLCGENDRLKAPRRRTSPKVINVAGRVCS